MIMNIFCLVRDYDRRDKQILSMRHVLAPTRGFACLPMRVSLALIVFLVILSPQRCLAYEIATPFGALYGAENHRHLGVDVIQNEQSIIVAPVSGIVSFCGKIPKTNGQRVVALTLKTSDNHLVTLSPLIDVGLIRGQSVKKDQVLGALAASGDPSLDVSHLHLSLRIQEKYVDPCGLVSQSFAETDQSKPGAQSSEPAAQGEVKLAEHTSSPTQLAQPDSYAVTSRQYRESPVVTSKTSAPLAATQSELILPSQPHDFVMSGLTMLKEQILQKAHPIEMGVNDSSIRSTANSSVQAEMPSGKRFSSLSQTTIAGILFLLGLTLTLAGWGGYTLLDGKFDIARKLEQLAVRGQR